MNPDWSASKAAAQDASATSSRLRGPSEFAVAATRVVHVFPTFDLGGAQARLASMLRRWPADSEHRVIALDGRYGALDAMPGAARVLPTPLALPKGRALETRWVMRRFLGEQAPDCLVTYNWGSLDVLLANWPGMCRHVHAEDGFGPDESGRRLRRRSWARAFAFRLTRAQVVVPSTTLRAIATEEWQVPSERLHHIPNGVDQLSAASGPRTGLADELRRWSAGRPLVVAVGALRSEKRFDRLIETISRTEGCALAIAGDGPERSRLSALIGRLRLDDRVRLLGHVSGPAEVLGAADVFALTSDTEQLPMALLEAMAMGLPAVCTNVGDVSHALAASNRRFVVPRAVEDLASALHALVGDSALRARIGEDNRARATAEFDHARMCDRWWALIRPGNGRSSGATFEAR